MKGCLCFTQITELHELWDNDWFYWHFLWNINFGKSPKMNVGCKVFRPKAFGLTDLVWVNIINIKLLGYYFAEYQWHIKSFYQQLTLVPYHLHLHQLTLFVNLEMYYTHMVLRWMIQTQVQDCYNPGDLSVPGCSSLWDCLQKLKDWRSSDSWNIHMPTIHRRVTLPDCWMREIGRASCRERV